MIKESLNMINEPLNMIKESLNLINESLDMTNEPLMAPKRERTGTPKAQRGSKGIKGDH